MAGHGGRLQSSVNGQTIDPGFVLPLSSNHLNGWRRIFTTLSPFVSRTSGRTLRVYARRLLTDEHNPTRNRPISIAPIGDRHPMGVWSSNNVHLARRNNDPLNSSSDSDNFSSLNSSESENVVINMDSNASREPHRRSSSPLGSANNNHIQLPSSSGTSNHDNYDDLNVNADPEMPALDNNQQAADNHSLSINGEPLADILERHPELRNVVKAIWQYCVFLLIIVAKVVYDKFTSLFIILLFFFGFLVSNKTIKLSVSHQERRSKRLMAAHLLVLVTIPFGIYAFYRTSPSNLYYSAVLLPSDSNYLSLGELLWIVIVTDFVIKLSSVFLKGLYALLPSFLLHYKNRGNHLAMIEFTSQLYRSLAPIQPWISYLLDNYTGIQKVFGVFLSALYMLCKGPDIIFRVKNFHYVLRKFLQDSKYGSVPSKDQLQDTGNLCPICQDDLVLPTMLQCKHIFCEQCVARWFDRERTCPMCRTKVADDPSYRDGSTSFAFQLY